MFLRSDALRISNSGGKEYERTDSEVNACSDWAWTANELVSFAGTSAFSTYGCAVVGGEVNFDAPGCKYTEDDMVTGTYFGANADTPTAWNLATCRTHCEAHWQTNINNYFKDGEGPYNYETSSVYRGFCNYLRYYTGASLTEYGSTCNSMFLYDNTQTMGTNYGLVTATVTPDDYYYYATAPLSHNCATSDMGGDPHIVNLKGESFDILQTGNFLMLSIADISGQERNLLRAEIEISRVGETCSEAYIQKLTLLGPWVSEFYGQERIEIRAQPEFIEIRLNDTWRPVHKLVEELAEIRNDPKQDQRRASKKRADRYNKMRPHRRSKFGMLRSFSQTYATVMIKNLAINIDIDNWNKSAKHDYQEKVRKLGWSFLNIQFFGIKALKENKGVALKGLLYEDDHSSVEKLPEDCKQFREADAMFTPFLSGLLTK